MNYTFEIEADSVDELTNTLTAIVAALKMATVPGMIRFARVPSINDNYRGRGLPLQPLEPDAAQALADAVIAAEDAEDAAEAAPVRRRRRRSANGSAGTDEDTTQPTVVQNPDGNVVAISQPMEAPVDLAALAKEVKPAPMAAPAPAPTIDPTALPEGFGEPPPEDTGANMAPNDMRERAINLMQQAFAYAAGPDLVRAVHRRLKVRKISDVPDAQCRELLDDATAILAQLKASGEPLDLLGMARGQKS